MFRPLTRIVRNGPGYSSLPLLVRPLLKERGRGEVEKSAQPPKPAPDAPENRQAEVAIAGSMRGRGLSQSQRKFGYSPLDHHLAIDSLSNYLTTDFLSVFRP